MTVLLLGAPINKKQTLATELAQQANLRFLDHSQLVRAAIDHVEDDSATGIALRQLVAAGTSIPDPLQVQLLRHAIGSEPSRLLLTSFPTTPEQAALLDDCLIELGAPIKRVLWVELSKNELLRHLVGTSSLSPSTAEIKASSFMVGALPLKTLYRERGLVRELDGNQSAAGLLRQAEKCLGF